jgi:predicted RNA-binding Zn-ribbon protein involved in translation (DUF1610 family)
VSDDNVIPFPKSADATPVESTAVQVCTECGWKMPNDVRAITDVGTKVRKLILYFDCPDCGATVVWVVEFQ